MFLPILHDVLLVPGTVYIIRKAAWFRPVMVREVLHTLH